MDCYSAESEFIESLDFLSPPVKRIHHSRETFGSIFQNEPNNVHLLRGLRNKFARLSPSSTKNTRTVKTNAESSTSLILKKTSERQILEHYSIVSYTNLQQPGDDNISNRKLEKNSHEKPLIKVTVIPRSDQVNATKILRKRRYIPKKIQSTTSNHENSVQTKNVYLIVAGRRREKIYEIKTTGSAQFSTDHDSFSKDEEIPMKELSSFKHLLQTLNMEKKKKKEKVNSMLLPDELQQSSIVTERGGGYPIQDSLGAESVHQEAKTHPKNRLRIFGKFGISQDDKYVLRYGATVDDKEVLSDVAQLTRDFSPLIGPMSGYSAAYVEDQQPQIDSNVQADIINEVKDKLNFEVIAAANTMHSKESQGTQVNFSVQFAKGSDQRYSDKKIQCCTSLGTEHQSDNKVLRDCQSPLVIISVYPNQSPDDPFKGNSDQSTPSIRRISPERISANTYMNSQIIKTDKGTKRTETRRNNKPYVSRSRSPSPAKKVSKTKLNEEKVLGSKFNKVPVMEKKSTDRHKALRAIKEKIQEKDKLKHDVNTRKPTKHIASNSTQVANKVQNITVSNATQVSRKFPQNITSSNGTQVSSRHRQGTALSNVTEHPKTAQKNQSNGVQAFNSRNLIAPVSIKKASHVANGTQVSKTRIPQLNVTNIGNNSTNNATQVSRNDRLTTSNGTQVAKNQQVFIESGISKNQATYTAPYPSMMLNESMTVAKEAGTNTDHAWTKKTLVENYTKQLTQQMDQHEIIPTKYDGSKVTININGDKECYDVLLQQSKQSTDLIIRKTLKDMSSQKSWDEGSASLENYFFVPDGIETRAEYVLPDIKGPSKYNSKGFNDSRSDDESPINKHVSRITIRDSLEISHRREDKSNLNNIKNTQTCFTAQFTDKITDETAFLAPIKHFIGDDCSLCNPIERDKQIRELLGVDRTRPSSYKNPAFGSEKDEDFSLQCLYREKSQVTELNFGLHKLHKFYPCFKKIPNNRKPDQSVSVQCQHTTCFTKPKYRSNYNDLGHTMINSFNIGNVPTARLTTSKKNTEKCFPRLNTDYSKAHYNLYRTKPKEPKTPCASVFQKLILNRNIQLFLQVEQFSKQKAIILSRKQYDKVKNTIQKTICKNKCSQGKKKSKDVNKPSRSEVSVGEVRRRRCNNIICYSNKEVQTELVPCSNDNCRKSKQGPKQTIQVLPFSTDTSTDTSRDQISDMEYQRTWEQQRIPGLTSGQPRTLVQSKKLPRPPAKSKVTSRCCGWRNRNIRSNENKAKQKAEIHLQNLELNLNSEVNTYTVDQSCGGDMLWFSDHSIKVMEDVSDEQIVKRLDQTREDGDRIGDQNVERQNKRNTEQSKEIKMDHGSERHNQHTRDERHSAQRRDRSPAVGRCSNHRQYTDQLNILRGPTSPSRTSQQREQINSGRSSRRKEVSSPNYEGKIGDIHSDQYGDEKEHRSPDRYREEIRPETDSDRIDKLNPVYNDKQEDDKKNRNETEVKTLILFNAEDERSKGSKNGNESENDLPSRRSMSSLEIRYASLAFMNQATYSSTDVGALSNSSLGHVNSFHTIFRGHRKSPTPNLGTSAYSLYSEEGFHSEKSAALIIVPRDLKQPTKKPFLRRLMSCLVMRSTRDSELKIPIGHAPELPSVNSSIDSYHISTTLGAIEVSSSIYDTSASFFSNHTILPVNSKIKRGFFSSVRGFLTNRKS